MIAHYSFIDIVRLIKWDIQGRRATRACNRIKKKLQAQNYQQSSTIDNSTNDKCELVVVKPDEVIDKDGTVIHIAISNDEDPEHPFLQKNEVISLTTRMGDRLEKKGVSRHVAATATATILGLTNTISLNQLLEVIESFPKHIPECKLVANSICNLYTKVKLFGDENVYSVNEVMSLDHLVDIVSYLLNIRQWNYSEPMHTILDITKQAYADEKKHFNEDTAMAPFIFGSIRTGAVNDMSLDGTIYPSPARISAINLTNLRNVFGDLLSNYPAHAFDVVRAPWNPNYIYPGVCKLFIGNMSFDIDLGSVAGNGYSIIIPFIHPDQVTEFLFCNIYKHRDIVKRYIDAGLNPALQMDENFVNQMRIDVDVIRSQMFRNFAIYAMFDFTNMSKIVRKLTDEQRARLENNLTHIVNMPWNWTTVALTRYRFSEYTSPDEFILVHDADVVTPYSWMFGGSPYQQQVIINFKRTGNGDPKVKILANGEHVNL